MEFQLPWSSKFQLSCNALVCSDQAEDNYQNVCIACLKCGHLMFFNTFRNAGTSATQPRRWSTTSGWAFLHCLCCSRCNSWGLQIKHCRAPIQLRHSRFNTHKGISNPLFLASNERAFTVTTSLCWRSLNVSSKNLLNMMKFSSTMVYIVWKLRYHMSDS